MILKLKDSKESDILCLLGNAKTPTERVYLLRELYASVHSREHPDLDTFIFDKKFLGLSKGEIRPNILNLLHLILDDEDIIEARLLLGSGSGKSWLVCLLMAYLTHELASYVDPALYFGLASDSQIALVNMSVSASQALNVIFKQYSSFIGRLSSFQNVNKKAMFDLGKNNVVDPFYFSDIDSANKEFQKEKYSEATGKLFFPEKKLMALSGHSKAESFFGYAVFAGLVDECDYVKKTISNKRKTEYEEATTPAEEIIAGLSKARKTRFKKKGKIVLISTTYAKTAPLTRRVSEIEKTGTEISLEDGTIILMKETLPVDRIHCYKKNDIIAVRGATYHFTGEKRSDYIQNENDIIAKRDYGSESPDSAFSALPDPEILERNCNMERKSPLTHDQTAFLEEFLKTANPKYSYFLHLDLALSGDNAAMSMAHKDFDISKFVIDFMMEIITSKERELRFSRIKGIVLILKQKGFNIVKITVDGWNSIQLRQDFATMGFETDLLSVDRIRSPYETFFENLFSNRIDYYWHDTFFRECRYLEDKGDKYDHPDRNPDGSKGSKDVLDSVVGAIFTCASSLQEILLSPEDVGRATKGILNINGFIIRDGEELPVCQIVKNTLTWNVKLPNLMNRSGFINSLDDYNIMMVIGYNFGTGFVIDYIDVIDLNEQFAYEDIAILLKGLNVRFVGIGNIVTYNILELMKKLNIRTISKDMNIVDKAKNKHVRPMMNLTADYVFSMINMIKKGELKICNDDRLVRDLYEVGENNFREKKFAISVASWLYYMMQDTRGLKEQSLPKPILSNNMGGRSTVPEKNNEIDVTTTSYKMPKPRLIKR